MKAESKPWRYQESVHFRPSFCLLERAVKAETFLLQWRKVNWIRWQIAVGLSPVGLWCPLSRSGFFLFCFVFFKGKLLEIIIICY